ncbi:MAG: 4'-phosphopantetheinyl transferase superfamily protein [Desulfovibrionaceae bacterium]|nr:4'-phosphopantetheinyl transferase superfamily protein [Desulfovibrionaceae bacterium]
MRLSADAIHFWYTPSLDWHIARGVSSFTEEERARAERIRSEEGYIRFAGGRAFIKEVLSWYVGTKPEEIRLTVNPFGKPAVAGLAFSLAHGNKSALLAVTNLPTVGVDLEDRATSAILKEPRALFPFLHAQERDRLADTLPDASLTLWVRKEAVIKACGTSLIQCARHIVASPAIQEPSVLCLHADGTIVSRWHSPLIQMDGSVIAYAYRERITQPELSWFIFPQTLVTG